MYSIRYPFEEHELSVEFITDHESYEGRYVHVLQSRTIGENVIAFVQKHCKSVAIIYMEDLDAFAVAPLYLDDSTARDIELSYYAIDGASPFYSEAHQDKLLLEARKNPALFAECVRSGDYATDATDFILRNIENAQSVKRDYGWLFSFSTKDGGEGTVYCMEESGEIPYAIGNATMQAKAVLDAVISMDDPLAFVKRFAKEKR